MANRFEFQCPIATLAHKHVIRIGTGAWELKGDREFSKLSIEPSYQSQLPGCSLHVVITNGEMIAV